MLSDQERDEYQQWGVPLPEHNPHITEEARDAFFANSSHLHGWKHEGIDVYCEGGEHRHGISLSPDKQLTGTDTDGHPIFSPVQICTNPMDPTRGLDS